LTDRAAPLLQRAVPPVGEDDHAGVVPVQRDRQVEVPIALEVEQGGAPRRLGEVEYFRRPESSLSIAPQHPHVPGKAARGHGIEPAIAVEVAQGKRPRAPDPGRKSPEREPGRTVVVEDSEVAGVLVGHHQVGRPVAVEVARGQRRGVVARAQRRGGPEGPPRPVGEEPHPSRRTSIDARRSQVQISIPIEVDRRGIEPAESEERGNQRGLESTSSIPEEQAGALRVS